MSTLALAPGLTSLVVGVGELAVSADVAERLVTYALGSCLGIAVIDPVARVAGLLHVMLPDSSIESGDGRPLTRFVDTGVPMLFREVYRLGAVKSRLLVRVAGGASANAEDGFQIGKRNILALRRILWRNGVLVHGQDVGGVQQSRTMVVEVGTGRVLVRSGTELRTL